MAQERGNVRYISIEYCDEVVLVLGSTEAVRGWRENKAGGKEYNDGIVEYDKRR